MINKKAFLFLLISFSILISEKTFSQAGQLDPTFGQGGVVTTAINSSGDNYTASMVIQSDGKIVTAGATVKGTDYTDTDIAVIRYNQNGELDNTFGTGGVAITPVGSASHGLSLAIQEDGKIVSAGYYNNGIDEDFCMVRYNTDGSLDNTFGTDGIVITSVGDSSDAAGSVAIQSDGKIVVAGRSHNGNNSDFALVRYNTNGFLDNTFGINGIVTTQVGNLSTVLSLSILDDGKILAAGLGRSDNGNNGNFAIARYNQNGSLDNTFSTNGIVTTQIGSSSCWANSVAIQGDGKIVAAGRSHNGNDLDFALVRYNMNGTLDNAFGMNGIVTTPIGAGHDEVYSVKIQNDGKIVAAGHADNGSDDDFAVVRYNENGNLDNTFGTNGIVTTQIGSLDNNSRSLAIQEDGKIVVAGFSFIGAYLNLNSVVVRYNTDGSFDNTFANFGTLITTIGGISLSQARSVALQDDGKIVAGGHFWNGNDFDFTIVRYNENGNLDDTFGSGGIVITDAGNSSDFIHSIAIQKDGKTVAAGYSDNDFAIVRYNPNGSLDNTFGGDGLVITPIGSSTDRATSVAIQSDGKIVAAGYFRNGNNNDFAVVRYLTNGNLDNTFGTNGIVITDIGSLSDLAYSSAIQSDGKIVVAGYSDNGNDEDIAIVRYDSNGALDSTFGTNGILTTQIGASDNRANTIAIQNDGKIIAGGYSYEGTYELSIVRYDENGVLDNTFGLNGILSSQIGERINSVAVQSDGKIVAAGYNEDNKDFIITRCNPNGDWDDTFGVDGIITTKIGASQNRAYAVAIQSDGKIVVAGDSYNGEWYSVFTIVRYLGDESTDVDEDNEEETIPTEFSLKQNYPNPFNPTTIISWQLPVSSRVSLKIYDVLGNEVATLVNEEKHPGNYEITFDANGLSSGVYFYRLQAVEFTDTKKFILLK